jgi:hypothetical protein
MTVYYIRYCMGCIDPMNIIPEPSDFRPRLL